MDSHSALSPDLIEHFKLETQFAQDHTLHVSYLPHRAQGFRKVKLEKRWYRDKEIGSGAFGNVWLEVIRGTEGVTAERAVKELRKGFLLNVGVDYRRELLALAALSKYPQKFIGFYGWYENTNTVFLAMEYFPYGDLGKYIALGITEHEAKRITIQLLQGLKVMHENKFTHRDLKPQNIFVISKSPNWWIKIGDFGITKRIGNDQTALRTHIGTPNFQAPEVSDLMDEENFEYTNAVDIWSLGCVTYNILAQKIPFQDRKALRLFCSHKASLPVEILHAKHISAECVSFLESLIVPEPSKRLTAETGSKASWFKTPQEPLEEVKRKKALKLLLSAGFHVEGHDFDPSEALIWAAEKGHEAVIRLLLEKGADINGQGFYSNALEAASRYGHDQIVQRLLENGADVNAQGGYYGNALQAASMEGRDQVVQRLLENGADVNAQGEYYGNALQAASIDGHDQIVKWLLENGADINAQEGFYGNALQAASRYGHDQIVQQLLENGADVNAQGGYYGNALQAASRGGHDQIVQRLLENGADVNTQGGYYDNALQAASMEGHDQVVQRLKSASRSQ